MPRNRYTRYVHAIEQHQRVHQEKELTKLVRQLRCGTVEPVIHSLAIGVKERRTSRLKQKSLHAPKTPELASSVPSVASNNHTRNVA